MEHYNYNLLYLDMDQTVILNSIYNNYEEIAQILRKHFDGDDNISYSFQSEKTECFNETHQKRWRSRIGEEYEKCSSPPELDKFY